ncbi:hypothetical protein WDU94_010107 [Cyamophila willieti]
MRIPGYSFQFVTSILSIFYIISVSMFFVTITNAVRFQGNNNYLFRRDLKAHPGELGTISNNKSNRIKDTVYGGDKKFS